MKVCLSKLLFVNIINSSFSSIENLWKFMNKINLTPETKLTYNHASIVLKDLLHSVWIRQMYLKREDIGRNEKKEFMFSWGFRAEYEINKLELLKWVCEVYGDGYEPHMFKLQYKRALSHDKMLSELDQEVEDTEPETE